MPDHPRRTAHERKQPRREWCADYAEHNRDDQCEDDRLNRGTRSAVRILFADAARNHCHRADA